MTTRTSSTTITLLIGLLVAVLALPAGAKKSKKTKRDNRPRMLKAMGAELKRSMNMLKMDGFKSPYFMAYEMKETNNHRIRARYGSLYQSGGGKTRRLRVEIRIGDHHLDNIGKKTSEFDFSFTPGYRASRYGPLDDDPASLRNTLWLLTDQVYKAALKGFLKIQSRRVTEVADKEFAGSFTKEKNKVSISKAKEFKFDKENWELLARSASSLFDKHPHVFDSSVEINGNRVTRYLVTSEGTRIISEQTLYHMTAHAYTRAPDGMLLTSQFTLYAPDEKGMPDKDQVFAKVKTMISELESLRKAPVLEPYTGPAILDGEATGVLFHEVIGHRLEGERQLDDKEGKTFKGQVGRKIIPPFLSVTDDPTLRKMEGVALNGFYEYDDEGVLAQKVNMVEDGVLKAFLMSRTPINGFMKSNGHGRSAPGEKPRARMGNTIVSSSNKVPFAKLKALLIDEVKKQGKPYGLIIKNIVGGSTHTSTWGYQAYKGIPQLVTRVFPDGREELVRGVEIVGTPLASINKIQATSDKMHIFNGFCGAESGYVPVSAAAPDVLLTEIELQRSMKKSAKGQIMQSPWSDIQ